MTTVCESNNLYKKRVGGVVADTAALGNQG